MFDRSLFRSVLPTEGKELCFDLITKREVLKDRRQRGPFSATVDLKDIFKKMDGKSPRSFHELLQFAAAAGVGKLFTESEVNQVRLLYDHHRSELLALKDRGEL